MFGQRKQKKYKRYNTLKVNKSEKRSRLDKVIDILDAAASHKDNQSSYKKTTKPKHKPKPKNDSGWNASINW